MDTLLGIKKQMTSSYDARGRRVGATVVEVSPNWVVQIKSIEGADGYNSVQLGTAEKKSVRKPQLGHFKKAGIDKNLRYLFEVKTSEPAELNLGQQISVSDIFSVGDMVKVTGTSKGKGFQGGVKRHGFAGGPKTHGQSDRHRAPGSIGAGTTPGRVYKGKKMAGHMGDDTVTVRGLEIISVDKDANLLVIKGGLPGASQGLLKITKLGKIKGYTPPPEEKPEEEEQVESSDKNQELSKENKDDEKKEEENANS